ncbi:hypothetical protein FTO70_03935 [Methanosarcina sp. KYL-1]|uniref:hypothetical protein n=1 Tax=Methanosarcina sp. KYL-1 TaxID=2602068 RepID=UPI002100FC19|nr:hypothetical protein [Methanosarcina sp. KYL-1]MCQ1534853.1 hypothetical protein [Methanosarcina sp. KYL-1]
MRIPVIGQRAELHDLQGLLSQFRDSFSRVILQELPAKEYIAAGRDKDQAQRDPLIVSFPERLE